MDAVEDVLVELVDRDLTVSVEVRVALLQPSTTALLKTDPRRFRRRRPLPTRTPSSSMP
jgi:hypothetical protein